MKYLFILLFMLCSCAQMDSKPVHMKILSDTEAKRQSPINVSCRGNRMIHYKDGKKLMLKNVAVPAYLRGDLNEDGLLNEKDAAVGIHPYFEPSKMLKCPAVADVTGYFDDHADQFYTVKDTMTFHEFNKNGEVTWEREHICATDCTLNTYSNF